MNEVGGEAGICFNQILLWSVQSEDPRVKVTKYPKFKNDRGLPEIQIGVKEFNCTGVAAPLDHPYPALPR